MPTPVTLRIGSVELTGQLNDSPAARALADAAHWVAAKTDRTMMVGDPWFA